MTALPPWSCEQIPILMVWAQLLILVSENHSHSVGCNAFSSAIPHYLSLKAALKHQKVEVSNAIISWLAAIFFFFFMIFSLFCQTMLAITDLKYPLSLEGTDIYKEIKITILCEALISYLLHHKSKEIFSLKNRYTITAITKHLPHPDQRGMQTLQCLEWSSVWAQNMSFKTKNYCVSYCVLLG